jgi:ribonuclease D
LLGRAGLAVLRELWKWREREAVASNKPPFFVLSHEVLVDIAAAAGTQRSFEAVLPRHLSERRRGGVMKAVALGIGTEPQQHPEILRPMGRRPNEAEKRRFMELQKRRDAQAEALQLDPTLIASRAVLSDLAHDYDKYLGELMKWQRDLLENHV